MNSTPAPLPPRETAELWIENKTFLSRTDDPFLPAAPAGVFV